MIGIIKTLNSGSEIISDWDDISGIAEFFLAIGFCLLAFSLLWGFSLVLDSATGSITERPVSYHNLTVLDKNAVERSLLSDTYNVFFATEDGEIIKLNNMTVYYSVEKGHTYNASFTYGFLGIVGEVN